MDLPTGEDINVATNLLPVGKFKLFELLFSNGQVGDQALQSACDSAKKLSKHSFLNLLRKRSKVYRCTIHVVSLTSQLYKCPMVVT